MTSAMAASVVLTFRCSTSRPYNVFNSGSIFALSGSSPAVITVAAAASGHAKWRIWAAAIEAGSPSLGNSIRDVFTTMFLSSAASRDKRACSASLPSHPRTTRRRPIDANTLVTTGTSTIAVNATVLKTPTAAPTVAITISSAPRALSPAPRASAPR